MWSKLKRMDPAILVILFIFMVLSTALVHSATVDDPKIKISIMKSIILYGVGIVAFVVTSLFDFKWLLKISPYLYGAGLAMLAGLFFVPPKNGARGWYQLPAGLDFQPAELMKLILILVVAAMIARRAGEQLELKRDVLPTGVIVFVPFAMVLVQPDLGNAIIFLVILLGMFWIGNIKYTHVLVGSTAVVGGAALFLYVYSHFHDPIYHYLYVHHVEHWADRIDTFLDPSSVDKDKKYQLENAITAIGSGGLLGEGFMKGNSIHSSRIPYAYSDSIFVVVGEEFGFVGAAILLLLYFWLIYRMILIAIQSTTVNGSFIIVGVISMFVFQIFENVGMLIGLMPLTGITLPFISYGGTSLLINMLSIGLVMSVKLHQEKELTF
ncbi:cell cycle protein [Gordoniibacillus kamchatkensis]|uniref:Cell cycle protein n=1 Tax=Gordoniibacillus kamchatkensis TaxID=1590651 RepID=A0ABR5AK01_9BACL|nr:FtsW/RodA/SpoVE family cell cycle protein [Paenibacillus sp. VKM B-2647]KIL41088.1 cell cycle protein [Paenibacillus sp. VKM B-2647]